MKASEFLTLQVGELIRFTPKSFGFNDLFVEEGTIFTVLRIHRSKGYTTVNHKGIERRLMPYEYERL